ncbi:MAG: phosphoribosylamine--glycine ligase [Bacteroidetes bacterium]|nr:phosphoribosylamine--glycine ligase [Bacteroidota bacterium]
MNILLLGSGGREHALAWKIKQSKKSGNLYIAPGNAGTALCGTNIAIDTVDFKKIKSFVLENKIEMVVVGPETPLVEGIHDYFLEDAELHHIPVIGPQKAGAMLEGSKDFSKKFMQRHGIPTAAYKTFTKNELRDGVIFINSLEPPYVLKADGLAAGKGVIITENQGEAVQVLNYMLADAMFGEASSKVVIEEYLSGIELSVFVATDGDSYKLLPVAKDYKRIGEGDSGPNTGGMGSVSHVPFADKTFMQKVEQKVVIPTINGLKKDNIPYKGFIFIGLMNVKGEPYVIEYNARLGDPETESVIPRIKSDIIDLFEGIANGNLKEKKIEFDERTAVCIMLVAKGYPDSYEKGKLIKNLDKVTDSMVFHAGTKTDANGNTISNGGRVIAITSFGKNIEEAKAISLKNAEIIDFEGKYYRKDIGKDLL